MNWNLWLNREFLWNLYIYLFFDGKILATKKWNLSVFERLEFSIRYPGNSNSVHGWKDWILRNCPMCLILQIFTLNRGWIFIDRIEEKLIRIQIFILRWWKMIKLHSKTFNGIIVATLGTLQNSFQSFHGNWHAV